VTALAETPYRPTPGATPLTWAKPRTPDWFAARRQGITATDVVAIIGEGWERTALHVYLDKLGAEPERQPSERMLWGLRHEPTIAAVWSEQHDVGVSPLPVLQSISTPWMLASPDYAVNDCPDGDGPCGLQVKTADAYVGGRWRDDYPDSVLAQTLWEMRVAVWGHEHVACLVGGNHLVDHRVDYDARIVQHLIAEAEQVWQHVLDQVPPDVDPSAAVVRLLDRMFPDRAGIMVHDREELAGWHRDYAEARAEEARAKARAEAIRDAAIVAMAAGAALAPAEDAFPVATYRQQTEPTVKISADAVRRLRREHPRTLRWLTRDGYVTSTQPRKFGWTAAAASLHDPEETRTDEQPDD